jgi:hypothetical protein
MALVMALVLLLSRARPNALFLDERRKGVKSASFEVLLLPLFSPHEEDISGPRNSLRWNWG